VDPAVTQLPASELGEATRAMLELAVQEGYDPQQVYAPGFLERSVCWVANEVAAHDSIQQVLGRGPYNGSWIGP
jgi:hypothetical protein